MPNKRKKLSWKPVRRGGFYCAPACGRDCTWNEYQLAKAKARALVKRLGKGWKAKVWENLGWHYNVTFAIEGSPEILRINENLGTYSASLGEHGGNTSYYSDKHFVQPEDAVRNQLKILYPHAQMVAANVAALERTAGKGKDA